jgi:hypothetical protein
MKEKDIWRMLRGMFPFLTGRNLNDAIMAAKAIIASQRKLLPSQLEKVKRQVKRTEARIKRELDCSNESSGEKLKALA